MVGKQQYLYAFPGESLKLRAGAQGNLAYAQVAETRSRQQEAQQLLGLIPQLQRGAVTGDVDLLQLLDRATNAPRERGLPMVQTLQRLPSWALADANAILG